jgi:hypothetical protein
VNRPREERVRSPLPSSSRLIIASLVLVRIVILVVAIVRFETRTIDEPTLIRFQQIAQNQGRPWRDFAVEYPPGQTLVLRITDGQDLPSLARDVALLACGADLLTAWLLGVGWGASAAIRYLVLGLPLVVFVYLRLDLVSVALATASFVLVQRGHERASGLTFASAVLFRLWPMVLFPMFLIQRARRAALWAVGATFVGAAGWIIWGGPDAVRQVVTFRGASGWEIGSCVGAVLWAIARRPVTVASGDYRVGIVGHAGLLLSAVLLFLLIAIWIRATRVRPDPAGWPALAAVAALLLCSPVLSDGFVSWLLPWAAIASVGGDRWVFRIVFLICLAQAVPYLVPGHLPTAGFQALVLLRIPLLISLPAMWFLRVPPDAPHAPAGSRDGGSLGASTLA